MPSRSAAVSPNVRANESSRTDSRSRLSATSSGGRREPAVEDEEELVLLAAAIELAGERAVQRQEVVGPLDHGDDHGDQPDIGGPGRWRALDGRLHEGALGGHDQRTSQAVGISRALSRSLLSATSATSPSMAR